LIISAYLSLTLFLLSADLLYVDIAGNKIKIGYFFLLGLWCFSPRGNVGASDSRRSQGRNMRSCR
jgi:hypothetical protein